MGKFVQGGKLLIGAESLAKILTFLSDWIHRDPFLQFCSRPPLLFGKKIGFSIFSSKQN
jgi:hypothetical protein